MARMLIRRARPDEADALTDLCLRSKQSNGYDDAFMAACRAELTVTPALMRDCEFWVADDGGGLAGCVALLVGADGRSGEVHAFFIEPSRKRQGIGRRLWTKIVERARDLGLVELHLDADPFAVPFYEALGFATIGSTPSGSIPGRRIPQMRVALSTNPPA